MNEKRHTCLPERFLGLLCIFMRFNPTPIAPELPKTTLWPWRFKSTTVSTTAESIERRGWWVVSWTIEEVPTGLLSKKVFSINESAHKVCNGTRSHSFPWLGIGVHDVYVEWEWLNRKGSKEILVLKTVKRAWNEGCPIYIRVWLRNPNSMCSHLQLKRTRWLEALKVL